MSVFVSEVDEAAHQHHVSDRRCYAFKIWPKRAAYTVKAFNSD